MATKKNFELGDLVWAKMKNYPFWPAQIVNPPVANEKAPLDAAKGLPKKKPSTSRKNQHHVLFFGTKNCAWILHENIVPHSEEMLNKEIKKKSGSYVKAVKDIIKASVGEDSVKVINHLDLLKSATQRIVKKLLNSGHNVSVWNRTPENCQECVTAGAQQFSTPADVVCNCDIIFCCVSGSEAVKSIVFENCGILDGLEKSEPGSKGYIELTSMGPVTLLEIYASITGKGGKYLEAPISASLDELVGEGLSVIPVAGNRQLLIDCLSCFHAIAKQICFMNCEVGTASKMNLLHSILKDFTLAALAESMALLEGGKHSHLPFSNFLPLSQMASPFILQKCQAMMNNNL
ncbi:putative oxidoreductase GLYR1 [Trichonephila inaurata madagascariensis]|uniref:Putative oxidoreductase GLYR1 n=1 Tax=Trichonephila inaurata madagascariensis TaxID=2747483 RepID=A0A8X7CI80_9ARAC|nr:putative oxidoreductase GLYR1 [Trichonephila inaurata madagascariensis]